MIFLLVSNRQGVYLSVSRDLYFDFMTVTVENNDSHKYLEPKSDFILLAALFKNGNLFLSTKFHKFSSDTMYFRIMSF